MNLEKYQDERIKNLQTQITSLECKHPKKEIRCRIASNNTKMFKVQCVRCGDLFGEWISHHKIKNPDNIIQINDNLRQNFNQSCAELESALKDRIKELDKIDFDAWYKDYLNSYEWSEKRRLVFIRCKKICEGCGNKKATEVHHITYANVGNEFLFELLGLCIDCHNKLHKEDGDD